MKRWNPFLRWPRAALAAFLMLLIAAGFSLRHFRFSSDAAILLEGDQRKASSYQKIREILKDNVVVVIDMECDDVFAPVGVDAVYRVSEAFRVQPGLVDVKSLTHSFKPVRRGFAFDMVPLVEPLERDPDALETLRAFCLENPLVRGVMVSEDARHTLITLTYRTDVSTFEAQSELKTAIAGTLAPFEEEGLKFHMISMPLVEQEIRATVLSDAGKFGIAASVFLLVVLALTLRDAKLVLFVAGNLVAMIILLPALFLAAGWPLNVLHFVLFPLLLAVQLTLLVHVVVAFQKAVADGGRSEAIPAALAATFRGCLFASMTTAVGMAALGTSSVGMVRDFGLQGAAGVVAVFSYTFGPALAALALTPVCREKSRRICENREARGRRMLDSILRFDLTGGRWIWGATIATAILIAIGVSRVRTDIRAIEFLNKESPTRQAAEVMNNVYGGINVFQIEIDSGAPAGINRKPMLDFIQEVQRHAESRPGVTGVYSYAQLLAMMNQIWEGGRPGTLHLPESPLLLNVFVSALQSQNFPFLKALCDEKLQTTYLIVRMPDLPSNQYLANLRDIVDFATANSPAEFSVNLKDGFHSVLESERAVLASQLHSGWLSVAAVGMALLALWRSARLAGCGLVINLLPVLGALALAGWTGMNLNSVTIMVVAIAFGIAVDDTVHFITSWRSSLTDGVTGQAALASALRQKLLPIFTTSVILTGMFGLFTLSTFPPIAAFGAMGATAMIGSFLAVVLLLPFALGHIPETRP